MNIEHLPRISARRIYLAKWLPFIVVGLLAAWQWVEESQQQSPDYFVPGVITLIVVGLLLRQQIRHAWPLADEVLDGGDYLIVKRGNDVVRVELAQISDAAASSTLGATTVFLHLSAPCRLGDTISFLADSRGNRGTPSPIASELISRIGKRGGHAA